MHDNENDVHDGDDDMRGEASDELAMVGRTSLRHWGVINIKLCLSVRVHHGDYDL